MEDVLMPLIRSPKFNRYYYELTQIFENEKEKRQRFYEEIKDSQKIEFINGEIIMQTPVKIEHDNISTNLLMILKAFVQKNNLGYVGHEKMLIALTRNDYEPDICYWRKEKSDRFIQGQMKFPAPDFIVEVISSSTEIIDRTIKFEDYAYHGVQEYWIVDPNNKIVEQYILKNDKYELRAKTDTGKIKLLSIPDLEIPIETIFNEKEILIFLKSIL